MHGQIPAAQDGFTLIELIAVVLIIALIAGVTVPNLDRLSPKYSLRSGAREIAGTVENCRSQSALAGRTYSVVYDLDEQQYWILLPQKLDEYGEPQDEEREILLPRRAPPEGVRIVEVTTPDNETRTSGQAQLDFSPYGNTGSHVVVVRYGEDENARIWVCTNALMGFTTFHYSEVGFEEYEPEEDDETYQPERTQTP